MMKKSFKTFLYLIATFLILAQSAFAYNVVKLSPEYFPSTSRGRPLSSAYIYVGEPDLDPTVVANQKTLSVQQEDGTIVAVTQPIRTNAGGVPQYLGSPVTLLVDGDYSLTVLSSSEVQVYYVPSVLYYTPLTTPYARYFPDYTEADQGVVGGGNSVYDILTEVGVVTGATLYFAHNSGAATTTYTFTTSDTLTDNFNIVIENGAIIDGAGTLTINGTFEAGLYQVFGPSITVDFTGGLVTKVYPEWFGAVADGSTNNYTAFTRAMTAATGPVCVSKSLLGFAIETKLSLPRQVDLIGFGAINFAYADTVYASKIKWTGAANGIMLEGESTSNSGNIIEGIAFIGDDTADHAIDLSLLRGVRVRECYFDGFLDDVLDLPTTNYFGIIEYNRVTKLADGKGFFYAPDRANGYVIANNTINLGRTTEDGSQSGGYAIKINANGAAIYGNNIEGTNTNYPTAGGRKGIVILTGSNRVSIFGNRIELSWETGQTESYGVDIQTPYDILGLQHNEIFTQKDGGSLPAYHLLFSHADGAFGGVAGVAGGYVTNPWAMDLFPRPDGPASHSYRLAGSDGTADGSFGAKGAGIYLYDGDTIVGWKKLSVIMDVNNTDISTSGTGNDNLRSTNIQANLLGTNRGLRFSAAGTVTNVGGGNKRVLIAFTNTALALPLANANEDWWVKGTIYNVTAASQRLEWTAGRATTPGTVYSGYDTFAADTTGAIPLKLIAECTNAMDTITQTMWLVELF